ncbi:V-type proton ATPase subunit G-like [Nymphaea colorata]|nr:V-type proton ATPase subunit G-like [Nymphaea colorata]XP_031493422.1 V-type proton ATPase subunit G-like [Nymphaea colorata]XP_031493431.1 V-type proton ATPase subunit G-like [Nymphaea colorata]
MENIRAQSQGGIQALLAAEQEAQQIVSSARNAKMARLKQAKQEAEREIAAFRAQLEAEHQKKNAGDASFAVNWLEQETEAKIQNLKNASAAVSQDIVSMIMKHVKTVKV